MGKVKKITGRTSPALQEISFTLNGGVVTCVVKPSAVLLDVVRDHFGLLGTKPGCHEGECGACTVLVDDLPVNSCLFLAVNANNKHVTTIEGLTLPDGSLNPVQKSLVENGGVQCGFCTSGMAISIQSMLDHYERTGRVPGGGQSLRPTRDEIKKYLEGNLCRCTGYVKIVDAAQKLFESEG